MVSQARRGSEGGGGEAGMALATTRERVVVGEKDEAWWKDSAWEGKEGRRV